MRIAAVVLIALLSACGGADCSPHCDDHGLGFFECSGGQMPPMRDCQLNGGHDAHACGAAWYCWTPGP